MIPRSTQIAVAVLLLAAFGLGFYALRLKRVTGEQQQIANEGPLAPPVAGPATPVTLWVADDADGALHPRQVTVMLPEDRTSGGADPAPARPKHVRELLRALLAQYVVPSSPHPLGSGADITEVFLVNDPSAPAGQTALLAVIDVNAAFANAHRPGILVEELTLASMARTLAANVPGISRMKVLVEGKERETLAGHASLTGAYELIRANQLAKTR